MVGVPHSIAFCAIEWGDDAGRDSRFLVYRSQKSFPRRSRLRLCRPGSNATITLNTCISSRQLLSSPSRNEAPLGRAGLFVLRFQVGGAGFRSNPRDSSTRNRLAGFTSASLVSWPWRVSPWIQGCKRPLTLRPNASTSTLRQTCSQPEI